MVFGLKNSIEVTKVSKQKIMIYVYCFYLCFLIIKKYWFNTIVHTTIDYDLSNI